MRSGRGENTQPPSVRRPSMRIVEVPAPSTQPPQRLRKAARSPISGSRAAPRSTVCPLAQAAASSKVSVAPTLGKLRVISAPCRPEGAVSSSLPGPAGCSCAPIFAKPARCRSTGRAPILHPPGSDVSARPSRASSGAQNRMEARICSAVCPGRVLQKGVPETHTSLPCQPAFSPVLRTRARQASTSESRGTPRSRTGFVHSRLAAISGSTLFFAAGMRTVPCKGRPPVTTICSARCAISAAPIPQKIPQTMQNHRPVSPGGGSLEFGRKFVWFLRAEPLRLAYARQLS